MSLRNRHHASKNAGKQKVPDEHRRKPQQLDVDLVGLAERRDRKEHRNRQDADEQERRHRLPPAPVELVDIRATPVER